MTKSLMDQALANTPWRRRWRLVATAKAIMNEARFDSLSEHRLRDREKPGATPPSHRTSPALLDTNAIASSASPHSKRGSALAVKDGHRGRSTASAVS